MGPGEAWDALMTLFINLPSEGRNLEHKFIEFASKLIAYKWDVLPAGRILPHFFFNSAVSNVLVAKPTSSSSSRVYNYFSS